MVFMLLYTTAVVALLHMAGFWTIALAKDTVFWCCFSGVVLAVNLITSEGNENIFWKIMADNVKLIIVIEFLVNAYVFSLPVELALVPIIALLTMMNALAHSDEQYSAVAKLTSGLLTVVGFAILLSAGFRAASDYANFGSIENIRRFLLPVVLSISFAPCIYLLMLFGAYELLFVRLEVGAEPEEAVKRHAKRHIIVHCGLSLKKLRAFSKAHALDLMRIQNKGDVADLFDSEQSEE